MEWIITLLACLYLVCWGNFFLAGGLGKAKEESKPLTARWHREWAKEIENFVTEYNKTTNQ